MSSYIEPNGWLALRLPSNSVKLLQATPNTIISLGKYGSFPSNLLIRRPFHYTYELQDRGPDGISTRLRIVPADELYAGIGDDPDNDTVAGAAATAVIAAVADDDGRVDAADSDKDGLATATTELVVPDGLGAENKDLQPVTRQTLTIEEIRALKADSTDAGEALIDKLLESHTHLDQKTRFSLAKYKVLKEKKHLRRFTVLPVDASLLNAWYLEDRDPSRVLEMREEMTALLGCWANIRHGGDDVAGVDLREETVVNEDESEVEMLNSPRTPAGTRFLIVDDTAGLLTAAMAERMGILVDTGKSSTASEKRSISSVNGNSGVKNVTAKDVSTAATATTTATATATATATRQHPSQPSDFCIPYSKTNTLTLVHAAPQPNLNALLHFGYDATHTNHPPHPLLNHLLSLTWLQLLNPTADTIYNSSPPIAGLEEVSSWKAARRGNYHRKRRRWARLRYTINDTRAGGFSGLVVASTMEPMSIMRSLLPLLAGGAPVAVYSASLEPLVQLADAFSLMRRSAWTGADAPVETLGKTAEELLNWEGNEDFPINPMLLGGAQIQTSRVMKWQVLPGRTHPVMTARGGAEGYIFTGWRAIAVEGSVAARGKFQKKRKIEAADASEV